MSKLVFLFIFIPALLFADETRFTNHNPGAVEEFKKIAEEGGGESIISPGRGDLIPTIKKLIRKARGRSLDLVLALDTTVSMFDEFPYLREELIPLIKESVKKFKKVRVGLLLYRDYFEQYLIRNYPFTDELSHIQENIDAVRVHGGKDIPEAVYEALYCGVELYEWAADSKLLILIGDAPPHPHPRGVVTKEMVYSLAKKTGVIIHTIILPEEEKMNDEEVKEKAVELSNDAFESVFDELNSGSLEMEKEGFLELVNDTFVKAIEENEEYTKNFKIDDVSVNNDDDGIYINISVSRRQDE